MAKMHKIEKKLELNCSAQKIFETLSVKLPDIPQLCSDKVPSITVRQGDWLSEGSTRKWDLHIGGKQTYVVDRIDGIDEENMEISRSFIDGEIMTGYKSLKAQARIIPNGNDNKSCFVIFSLEYEKMNEDAPEPTEFFDFILGVTMELGHQLSSVN